MAKNVIELNGKRYDAFTGEYLGAGEGKPYTPAAKSASTKSPKKPTGRHIDGFIRPSESKATKSAAVKKPKIMDFSAPERVVHASSYKPIAAKDVHKKATKAVSAPRPPKKPVTPAVPAKHAANSLPAAKTVKKPVVARALTNTKARTPQHAKTLMRHVVKKPAYSIKPAIRTQTAAEIAPVEPSSLLFKSSVSRVDKARLKRAKAIAKATGIQHFMPVTPDYTPEQTAPSVFSSMSSTVPVIAVQPVPAHAHGKLTTHKPGTASHQSHTDIFEAAIARANSHKQPKHPVKHSRSRRLVNTMALVAAFLVIGGFVTYLNVPNITLHVASIQAGFKAKMPEYKPTGYALQGGVQRSGNTVSLRFQSGENQYTITQQPSVWNSRTLEENTLALSTNRHKAIEVGGRTIFIYGGSNAIWVNGGVRYDITTNTPLSTEDITKLAASL